MRVHERSYIWTAKKIWRHQWSSQLNIYSLSSCEVCKIFRLERDSNPWPLRSRCSALPKELSNQLGAGHVNNMTIFFFFLFFFFMVKRHAFVSMKCFQFCFLSLAAHVVRIQPLIITLQGLRTQNDSQFAPFSTSHCKTCTWPFPAAVTKRKKINANSVKRMRTAYNLIKLMYASIFAD